MFYPHSSTDSVDSLSLSSSSSFARILILGFRIAAKSSIWDSYPSDYLEGLGLGFGIAGAPSQMRRQQNAEGSVGTEISVPHRPHPGDRAEAPKGLNLFFICFFLLIHSEFYGVDDDCKILMVMMWCRR